MMQIYKLRNFVKTYNEKRILNIKKFDVNEFEILALMGKNGSGKSTLLRHLAFLEKQNSGEIYYKNQQNLNAKNPLKKEISILFAEPYLLKRNVRENLLFGLKAYKINCDFNKEINKTLDLIGLSKSFLKRYPNELSSGEKQRVAFGSRLILKPKTMLLDEPTNSLDDKGILRFSDAILNTKEHTTFIIASHDKVWLNTICTRKVMIKNGDLEEDRLYLQGNFKQENEHIVCTLEDNQSINLPNITNFNPNLGYELNPNKLQISRDLKNGLSCQIISISNSNNQVKITLKLADQEIPILLKYKIYEKENFRLCENLFLKIL